MADGQNMLEPPGELGNQNSSGTPMYNIDKTRRHKKARKRLAEGSPELDDNVDEKEDDQNYIEETVKQVSDAISELANKVKNNKYKLKDLIKEIEKLEEINQSDLIEDILPILAKDKSRKIDFQLERHYCNRCEIEISREEEEKKLIIENVKAGENMSNEEYLKLLDIIWPGEAYQKTSLVTGNVLSFQGDELLIILENMREDSILMGMVKDRFPEVSEVLVEDGGVEESIPYLENIIKTKKGATKKRIYFLEARDDKVLKEKLVQFREGSEREGNNKLAVAVSAKKIRERVRKSLEIIFSQKELKIDFHVPSSDLQRTRDGSKVRGERHRSEAIVIDTNVSTYADTLRNIRAVVDLDQLGIQVKTVKATREKKMVIVTEEGQAEALHKEISAKVTGVEMRITGRERHTPLLILDIDASLKGKEIEDIIRKTTKVYEMELRSLRIGRSGTQIAVVLMPAKAAEELLASGDIKIGWTRCRVKPKIDVLKCFNCLKLGHHSDICREERTDKKCMNCTQVGHMIRECDKPSFCPMCNREGHRSDSRYCPSYRMRIQEATDQWKSSNRKQDGRNDIMEVELEDDT